MTNLLVAVGEGLGNVIQTLPLIKALSKMYKIHVVNVSYVPTKDVEYLIKEYAILAKENVNYIGRIELATTKGSLVCDWRLKFPILNDINKQFIYTKDRNEIEVYLQAASDIIDKIDNSIYNIKISTHETKAYDIIFHNGCSTTNPTEWSRKKYPHMKVLIEELIKKGYSIANIGTIGEYLVGEDRTGISLKETASLIKNCKCYLGNDSGPSHLAALLKTKGVLIYTATCTHKNYNKNFHGSLEVVRQSLPCQSCQYTRNWNKCSRTTYNKFECQNLDPNIPLRRVLDVLQSEKTL